MNFLFSKRVLSPLVLFTVICFFLAAWSVLDGKPAPSIDDLAYKYPGFHLVKHGKFAVPALEGFYPGLDKIYLINPPLYPLCFAAWVLIFGFSLPSALIFEFILHFLTALCLYKIVNKLVFPASEYWAFAVGLVYFLPLSYLDRPEKLSTLFCLIAFYIVFFIPAIKLRPKAVLAGGLIGLAISSHLVVGGFYLIYLIFSLFDHKRLRESAGSILVITAISISAAILIWLPVILPGKNYFFGQFIGHFSNQVASARNVFVNLMETFKYLKFSLPFIAALLFFPLFYRWLNRISLARKSGGVFSLIGAYFVVGLCVIFTSTKSTYFAALLPLIYLSVIGDIVLWFGKPQSRGVWGWLIKAVLIIGVPLHLMLSMLGYLTSFFADEEDRYEFSYKRISPQIPQGAKVLTDCTFWYCLAEKARIYDLYFTWPEQIKYCDYILLSANGSGIPGLPAILKNSFARVYIEKNFEIVDSTLFLEPNKVFGVPVSHSRWGYRFILYKRKT